MADKAPSLWALLGELLDADSELVERRERRRQQRHEAKAAKQAAERKSGPMEVDKPDDEGWDLDEDVFALDTDESSVTEDLGGKEDLEDLEGFLAARRKRGDPDYAVKRREALHNIVSQYS
jgi:hypothetical protein